MPNVELHFIYFYHFVQMDQAQSSYYNFNCKVKTILYSARKRKLKNLIKIHFSFFSLRRVNLIYRTMNDVYIHRSLVPAYVVYVCTSMKQTFYLLFRQKMILTLNRQQLHNKKNCAFSFC